MKILTVLTLLMALAMTLLTSSCQRTTPKFSVGVSQCSMDSWREKFIDELRTTALLTDSMKVTVRSANDDDEEQRRQIEQFVAEGVDLLVVSPNQMTSVADAIDAAYDRGIPVILYDRKSGSDKYTSFVGCDNHQIGQAMGSYIAQRLGGRGRVAEIRGLDGSSPAVERHRGLQEALGAYPDIELVASESGDWKRESGARAMRKILDDVGSVDYVFAHNDRMAMGARDVAGGGCCLFAGVDGLATDSGGLALVMDGLLDASYLYPTKGDEVVCLAMKILTDRPFERENMLQTSIVTHENAELSLMEARDAELQRANLGLLHHQVDWYMSKMRTQRVLTMALVVILALLMAIVIIIYRNLIDKARMNERLRQLNEQVIAQTHSRLVFFTNISHELRTPLTLIIDPVEQMMHDAAIRGRSRELLDLIKRNAVQLQQLVSTILDFRKIQNGKMPLNLESVDLTADLRQWVTDFGPTADRKRINLHMDATAFSRPTVVTDREKLSRIVFNLMSNALKYTPVGGDVFVSLADSADGRFQISVRDTGKGISADDCARVFDRFFQASGSQAGTGVGLAVVKSYSELLQGTATVKSEEGHGAEFTVEFPRAVTEEGRPEIPMLYEGAVGETSDDVRMPPELLPGTVLVIDDNEDVRQYMRTILHPHYEVLEAADGEQGLAVARREVPDVVVTDVMMPGMDGMEVCRTLKRNVATSHIPVILLTAKVMDEQRAEGYECGADSYITKPFNSRVLIARIDNMLRQRALLRERFAGAESKEADAAAEDDPRERTFMQQLRHVIDENLSDSDFSVEQLGAEMGLSRVQLYRKVKALTGTPVVDLVRRARLAKAHQMLPTTHRTIAEVAYDVGFTSPSYFAKCFKDEYGVSPGDLVGVKKS